MSNRRVSTDAIFVGAVVALLSGCSSTAAQPPKPILPGDIVATVGATRFTLAQVDEKALEQETGSFGGMKLSQALYEARRAAIEDLVDDALIAQDAAARKLAREAVIEQEITAKVARVTDADIAAWFGQNQARVQGATLDQAHDAIGSFLLQQRTQTAREAYVTRLRGTADIRVALNPPRQSVPAAGRPAKGPANAAIEIIEFSDFQCPFCLQAFPTVNQVMATYGEKVRLVYRHYPLPNHANARPAAEAAQCAAEQGQFWPYHDRLFGGQSRLTEADLKQYAAQIGLNTGVFNACVDSHKYKADVEADIKAGNAAGVTGTPAFFINGRSLSGAQPFAEFKRLIDDELAAKRP
ncbi:MAG: DsbA family protein [Acidobacteriota bacterium]